MDEMLKVAIGAALEAGSLLRAGFSKKVPFKTKGPDQEIVSPYDGRSERLLVKRIKKHYPHSSFILEEEGTLLKENGSPLWVIDPLDGTTNFVNGIPFFAISIAGFLNGHPSIGVIYHPISGELFTAQKGEGAYLNGKRLRIKKGKSLRMFATSFPTNPKEDQVTYNLLHYLFAHRIRVRDFGSSALEMAYLAANRIDVFWMSKPKAWDIAAGALLIAEAGGSVEFYHSTHNHILQPRNLFAY